MLIETKFQFSNLKSSVQSRILTWLPLNPKNWLLCFAGIRIWLFCLSVWQFECHRTVQVCVAVWIQLSVLQFGPECLCCSLNVAVVGITQGQIKFLVWERLAGTHQCHFFSLAVIYVFSPNCLEDINDDVLNQNLTVLGSAVSVGTVLPVLYTN